MSTGVTQDIVRHFFDTAHNCGIPAIADELVADNYVDHDGFLGLFPQGRTCSDLLRTLRRGFSDGRYVIDDLKATAERAVVHTTFRGTHDGHFDGLPPSGRHVTATGVHFFLLKLGHIVEHRAYENICALYDKPKPGLARETGLAG